MSVGDRTSESLAGRVAVVVGAAGGIGREIAARLASAGCQLALIDLDSERLDEVIGTLGIDSTALPCAADITQRAAVDRAAQAVEERFGRADILVNTAGINTRERTLADMSPAQWEHVIAVDLNGVFHCTQAFLSLMRRGGGGTIVTIASTAARLVSPGAGTHYCAAKRALLSLTESVNIEQSAHGIRACTIVPGEVDTPLVDKRPEPPGPERRAAMLRPMDVAEAVYYVVTRPARVTVSEVVIWPTSQISGVHVV
jgi:NAD(P)-dependent dehydrogenase (short-subunit alcohol dehydrogenase family)